ncbi:MAG: FHA domain-containing protein [Sulfolobaceae archaeon]
MPWLCSVCGTSNEDDAIYCINCGVKKQETQQQSSSNPPQQPSTAQQEQNVLPPPSSQPLTQPSQVQQQEVKVHEEKKLEGKYYLQIISTPNQNLIGGKIPLDLVNFPKISIGRSPENVIIIPDPEVSRRHSVISKEGEKLYLEDLNSTNGTYIYDGEKFVPIKQRTEIKENTIIKLGNNTIIKIIKE